MNRLRAIAPRCLFAAAVLATAVAFAWTEENWRAARDWAACQCEAAAHGERLDLSATYDPLPPARNLAWSPLFTRWFAYTVDAAGGLVTFPPGTRCRLPPLEYMPTAPEDRTPGGSSLLSVYHGERVDLPAWQASYRQRAAYFGLPPVAEGAALPAPAEDVLRALETFAPVLNDAERCAETMPAGVFALAPASFSGGSSLAVRRVTQTLALRADARLALGQNAGARHDLESILWLRQATTSQPRSFLNAALGCNHLELALQVVWQGLADHRWTADDLAAIQRRLADLAPLADYRRAASGQRAEYLFFADGLLAGKYSFADLFDPGDGWKGRVSAWALLHGPSGWLVQNRVSMTRFFQDHLLTCVDVPAHRFYPEHLSASLAALERTLAPPIWPWRYLMAVGMPGFLRVAERCALVQTALDEAVVACALERHALAHGGVYPANLAALVPANLDRVPTGVVDGLPLRYTPTPDGRCRLAAPLPLRETGKPKGSMVQGDDLVWSYPPQGQQR
ncbi:MAG: hypothetical protein INR65_02560 [Gluconacetobacter diazotrophicus]|nr:hypothetical protein [Gluconacetobacter diazotrophicus]